MSALVPLGRVLVYHGSSNGLPATATMTLVPASLGAISQHWFGYAVACADVNHDGFCDVIVGAPHFSRGEANEGAIFVYLGSASGLGRTPARLVEGGAAGAQFGYSVAAGGDVNGDGYADVLVGAPFFTFDFPVIEVGYASLYLGSSTGLGTNASWRRQGGFRGERFGFSLAGVGDLNGDGLSDVVISSPYLDRGQAGQEGRISVYLGSSGRVSLGEPVWVKYSQLPDALFGLAITGQESCVGLR